MIGEGGSRAGRAPSSLLLLAVLLLAGCAPRGTGAIHAQPEEAFIGWKGESYRPDSVHGSSVGAKRKWLEVVAWKPRAFIYHNFLSDEECEHIKRVAAPMMKRSTVVATNGSSVLDDYRTSFGTFLKRRADPVITEVEQRVARWAHLPEVNAEDMQVLRYGQGQQYKPHMDSIRDEVAGPRVCTVLLYLNDVIEGGETAFPDSNFWADPRLRDRMSPLSPCAKGSVAFKPKKGDAFMFWSVHPDGQREDSFAMHTGCPVVQGVKWTATKWIHAGPFREAAFGNLDPYESFDPGVCGDHHPNCKDWKAEGECTRNPQFMTGDVGSPGHCPLSCGACTVCAEGDRACYDDNRRRSGYLVYDEGDLDSDAHAAKSAAAAAAAGGEPGKS